MKGASVEICWSKCGDIRTEQAVVACAYFDTPFSIFETLPGVAELYYDSCEKVSDRAFSNVLVTSSETAILERTTIVFSILAAGQILYWL